MFKNKSVKLTFGQLTHNKFNSVINVLN